MSEDPTTPYFGPVVVQAPSRRIELDHHFLTALLTGAFPDEKRPGTGRWKERLTHRAFSLDRFPVNLTATQAAEFGRELEYYLPDIPEPFTGEILDYVNRVGEDGQFHDYVVVKGVGWVEVDMGWLPFQETPEARQRLLDVIALLKSGPVRISAPGVRYPEGEVRKFKRRKVQC